MRQQNKKFVKRSHPYQYNYNSNNSSTSFYLTIPEAKRAGAIDRIENGETKLKLIILFQENMNFIKLTAIPHTYFLRFNSRIKYTGKFVRKNLNFRFFFFYQRLIYICIYFI